MSSVRILLAGDVMTGRGIDQVQRHPGDPTLYETYVDDARDYVRLAERANGAIPAPVDPGYVWGDALAVMQRADIALRFVNLETAVTRSDEPWPGKGINYRMHPANVDCLTVPGIDGCALANNHVLDWGHAGLSETLQALHAAGLHTAGAGGDRGSAWRPAVLNQPQGGRVLVFSVALPTSGVPDDWAAGRHRPGVAFLPDLSRPSLHDVERAIAAARRPGDIVIVSIHWGGNWGLDIPSGHRDFAHALIDRGAADLIHGHSSHHPLPPEVHAGKLVLYGCGDLVNDYEGIARHGSLRSDVGCLYVASLAPGGTLEALEIVPMQLRRFRLQHADPTARAWLAQVLGESGARHLTPVKTDNAPGASIA